MVVETAIFISIVVIIILQNPVETVNDCHTPVWFFCRLSFFFDENCHNNDDDDDYDDDEDEL